MTHNKNINGKKSHRLEITERSTKGVILEGMNLCQRHNDSIKRLASNSSGGAAPFDLDAAWADIQQTCAANAGKSFTESVSTIPITVEGQYPTGSAVLAPGGIIYMIPYMHTKIVKLDTNTDTITQISINLGDSSLRKYSGAALAPNGYIYAVPAYAGNVLKINPRDDSYTTIGSLGTTSYAKYLGAVAAPNGCVYGIPSKADKVLKIDPITDAISFLPPAFSIASDGNWQGASLSRNGCIYGIPRSYNGYLKIDPSNDVVTTFGTYSGANQPWTCCSLAPNGHIYGVNHLSQSTLKINTQTDTVLTFGSGWVSRYGSVLAPNGYIYGVPRDTNYIAKINPANDSMLPSVYSAAKNYANAILAPNGYIYAFPNGPGNVYILKLNPGADVCQNFKESTLLSPYLNKY